jgi:hypothetical protein
LHAPREKSNGRGEIPSLKMEILWIGLYGICMYIYIYLVGGIPTPLKNMSE